MFRNLTYSLIFMGLATVHGANTIKKEKILMVTAEQTGVFNTGGLGHTTAGLARALKESGEQVDVLMPYYSTLASEVQANVVYENMEYHIPWGPEDQKPLKIQIYSVTNPQNGVKTYLLKSTDPAGLFDNPKLPGQALRYTNRKSEEEAFAMFNKAAAAFINRRNYTLVNTHDWHAGLVGYYLKQDASARLNPNPDQRVLFTISNLGYQGLAHPAVLGAGGPDSQLFHPEKYEFYGKFNMLKAGIIDSDAVLTVSENYLSDIKTERFGHGLDGFLRHVEKQKPIVAIRNGADVSQWIPKDFSSTDFSGKLKGKVKLQTELGLEVGEKKPLFVMTSRLAHQKGYDYLPSAVDAFLAKDLKAQVVIMGDGEAKYVDAVKQLQLKYPKRFVYREFSSALEKPLTQYSDFFVNVPWYEPSGTNQIFAMASGTVPVVSNVGGLPNYVEEGQTGIVANIHFAGMGSDVHIAETQLEILKVFERASELFSDRPKYQDVAARAMNQDNSWNSRVPSYRDLFRRMHETPSKLAMATPFGISASSCNELYKSLMPYIRRIHIHDK